MAVMFSSPSRDDCSPGTLCDDGFHPRQEVGSTLFIEPDILHTRTVGDAVDHDRQTLHIRLPAGRATVVEDDRPGAILCQSSFDFPHQLLTPFLVGFGRLLIDQPVHLGIAVTVVVQLAAAPVI